MACRIDEPGCRVDGQRCSHHEHLVRGRDQRMRFFHVLRLLAEPDDVGPQLRAFLAFLAELDRCAIDAMTPAPGTRAARVCELTVHVQYTRRTCALVQR